MIYRRILQASLLFFVVVVLSTLNSCEKFSGDQSVPAYISIDSIALQISDPGVEGTASHSITDAWVFIDDEALGAFQLPACFPVLKKGPHKMTVYAGIKRDGIGSTRVTYPFYAMIQKDLTLAEADTVPIKLLKATYETTTSFTWKEDFEDISLSLDTTTRSNTGLHTTTSGSPLTFEGSHSGMIVLDSTHNFFEIATHDQYSIPVNKPIYLEMNFNTNLQFNVGVYIYASGYLVYQVPILTLVPTNNKWKKIYIDLSVSLNAYTGGQSYRVYMANFVGQDVTGGRVLLDNFKLVTRK
jgi:hypothetical protein